LISDRFRSYAFPHRSDYIFTLFFEGAGASGHLTLRAFALVVEPSSFSEARLLIVRSGFSSNSPAYCHIVTDEGSNGVYFLFCLGIIASL
jgi:hypothetical protein